jgi:hypothetical protein
MGWRKQRARQRERQWRTVSLRLSTLLDQPGIELLASHEVLDQYQGIEFRQQRTAPRGWPCLGKTPDGLLGLFLLPVSPEEEDSFRRMQDLGIADLLAKITEEEEKVLLFVADSAQLDAVLKARIGRFRGEAQE